MLRRCRHGIRLLATSSSSSYHTIQAVPREWTGSKVAARERTQGRIPSVVFRQGKIEDITNGRRPISKKHLLTTDRKQINSILKTVQQLFFCSTTFNLQIRAGPSSSLLLDSGTVLPIKVHTNPENGEILNLVFVWADGDSELNVDVPLVFKGEDVCPGLKKGWQMIDHRHIVLRYHHLHHRVVIPATPIRQEAAQLNSLIGSLVKTYVPPIYAAWTDVPSELKEQIWKEVSGTYTIGLIHRKHKGRMSRSLARMSSWQLTRGRTGHHQAPKWTR